MKSSSKWLIGFGAVIGALMITAIVLVLAIPTDDEGDLPPEGTPEGTVIRYLKAIESGNYTRAYGYLSKSALAEHEEYSYMDTYEKWLKRYVYRPGGDAWKITIGEITELDEFTTVMVTVSIFEPESPFSNPVRTFQELFILEKENGRWVIKEPLAIWWGIKVTPATTDMAGRYL